jgi:hypothetical protein
MKFRTISLALALLLSFSTVGPSLAFHSVSMDASTATLAPQGPDAIAGCLMFPPDNVWNTRVDSLPVDARSSVYINSIGADTGLHPDFGSGLWDGGPIGIPYTAVPGTQPPVPVTFDYDDESDPGPYPIPPNVPIEYGSDHHVLVVDRDHCKLYEMWNSRLNPNGGWLAGSGAVFDLRSNALRPDTWTSADAAGLPILPGLVRCDEVQAGAINHALRFTADDTQRKYIWPARHYASSITDPDVPPMGQRFRLKASFDISGYSTQTQIILTALKTYGLILADNGSNWYVSGSPGACWNDDDLVNELRTVHGSDFEAVDESGLMMDPNSGLALGSVTDLRVVNAITGGGMLTTTLDWTAPINAITTTVRYFGVSIAETNWSSATVITNNLPGSATVLTAVVPYSGGMVYFALKSQSASGVWSALSNNSFWPHWDVYLPVVLR